MSEQIIELPAVQNIDPQIQSESVLRFTGQLENLALKVGEVDTRKSELLEAGAEIIEQFTLEPAFFDEEDRSFVLTAISGRWADNKGQEGPEAEAEQQFLYDAIALVGHNHSEKLSEAHLQIESEDSPISDEGLDAVYEKYTSKELTESVKQKIVEGLLSGVKERLGITAENEDPYDVRVLSIADSNQLYGIDAPPINYDLGYNDPEYSEAQDLSDDIHVWKKGLEERTDLFATEQGKDKNFAPVWVTTINGKRTICISTGLGEKIADPNITKNNSYYSNEDSISDLAMFEHEYTHTQGGVAVDNGITFGINAEELRAEHFSGDKNGYQDIKGFFRDYRIITGQNVAEEIGKLTKGGSTTEVFGEVANKIGLARSLEVMMSSPNNYIENQSNQYIREAYNYIGGFDGTLERILLDQIQSGNGAEVEQRIEEAAERLVKAVTEPDASVDLDSISSYRKEFGLNVITDLLNQKAQQIIESRVAA